MINSPETILCAFENALTDSCTQHIILSPTPKAYRKNEAVTAPVLAAAAAHSTQNTQGRHQTRDMYLSLPQCAAFSGDPRSSAEFRLFLASQIPAEENGVGG